MRNGIRIVAGMFLGLALVIVLLLFLGPWIFSSEVLHGQLESRLSAALRRPVTIGSVRVRLVPQPTVQIKDLSFGVDAAGDRSTGTVSALFLRAAWRPLLQRRLEVHRIEIDHPVVELVPEGSEPTGLDPAQAADGPTPDSDPAPTQLLDIRIDELSVRDGVIRRIDPDGNTAFVLEGWNETLAIEVTREGRFNLTGRTEIASWQVRSAAGTFGRGLPVRWDKTFTYVADQDELGIAVSDFLLGELPLTVTGTIRAATSEDPQLDLKFSGGPTPVDGLLGMIPPNLVPALDGIESSGILRLSGHFLGSALPDQPVDYGLGIELEAGRLLHPALSEPVEPLTLSLRLQPDQLRIDRASARSGDNRIQVQGVVTHLDQDPVLDLALDADVSLAWMIALRPPLPGAPRLSGRVQSQLAVRGAVSRPEELTVLGLLDLEDVGLTAAAMNPPLTGMFGRLEVEDQTLRTGDLRFELGQSDFTVRGTIANYFAFLPESDLEESNVNLTLLCRWLDLDQFSAEDPAPVVDPAVDPAANQALSLFQKMRGPLQLRADEMVVRGVRTKNAVGTAQLNRGRIEVDELTMRVFGGQASLQGTVDLRHANEPVFDLRTRVSSIDVSTLLRESVPLGKLTAMTGLLGGTLDGTADFEGDLDQAFALQLPSLTSIGNVKLVEGKLDGHPVQAAMAGFLNLPELQTLEFSDWLQPFEIRDGRLYFEGLNLQAGEYELQADGWQSIDGRVEIAASLLLPRSAAQGLKRKLPAEVVPILFGGTGARVLVPLQVSGPTAEPRVTLDSDRVTAQARELAEKRIATERRALEERLQMERARAEEGARDWLGGLLGSSADSMAADSTVAPSGVEAELKNILEGFFKK